MTPNKANMLGVMATYKLNGSDHMKAITINDFLNIKAETMAKQAGRHSVINIFNIGSKLVVFE